MKGELLDFLKIFSNVVINNDEIIINNLTYKMHSNYGWSIKSNGLIFNILEKESMERNTPCLAFIGGENAIKDSTIILPKDVIEIGNCQGVQADTLIGYGVERVVKYSFYKAKIKKIVFPKLKNIESRAFINSGLQFLPDFSKLEGELGGFVQCKNIIGSQKITHDGVIYEKGVIRIPKNITKIDNFISLADKNTKFKLVFEPDNNEQSLSFNHGFKNINIESISGLDKYKKITANVCFSNVKIDDLLISENFDSKSKDICMSSSISKLIDLRKTINEQAYYGDTFLNNEQISFPNATKIEKRAFFCSALEKINKKMFPNKLDYIGEMAFANIINLCSVDIEAKEIKEKAFHYDARITNFKINPDVVLDKNSIPYYLHKDLDISDKSKFNFFSIGLGVSNRETQKNVLEHLTKYKNGYYVGTKDNPYEICVHSKIGNIEQCPDIESYFSTVNNSRNVPPDCFVELNKAEVEYHPDCKYTTELMQSYYGGYRSDDLYNMLDINDKRSNMLYTETSTSVFLKTVSKKSFAFNESETFGRITIIKDTCEEVVVDEGIYLHNQSIVFPKHLKKLTFSFSDKELSSGKLRCDIGIFLPDSVDNISYSSKNIVCDNKEGPLFYITKNTSPNVVNAFANAFGYSPERKDLTLILVDSDTMNELEKIPYNKYVANLKKGKSAER